MLNFRIFSVKLSSTIILKVPMKYLRSFGNLNSTLNILKCPIKFNLMVLTVLLG